MIKIIIVISLIISITTSSYAQVKNCTISLIDSTNIKINYKYVNLESFYSDTLTFSVDFKLHSTSINRIVSLSYNSGKKPLTGFLIGGGIAFASTAFLLTSLSGYSHNSGDKPRFFAILGGAVIVGAIGAVIGGIVQKSEIVREDVNFMELSKAEKQIKLRSIFEFYDEKNK